MGIRSPSGVDGLSCGVTRPSGLTTDLTEIPSYYLWGGLGGSVFFFALEGEQNEFLF